MIRVLVLADIRYATQNRVCVLDQVQFLGHASRDRVQVAYVNLADGTPFDPAWRSFDVVLLHGTVLEWRWHAERVALESRLEWLTTFDGLVAAMPGDECLYAHELDDMLAVHNVQLVMTVFDKVTCAVLYPRVHRSVQFLQMLPTYVHPARVRHIAAQRQPLASRPTDVMYRGTTQPFWNGELARRKEQLLHRASLGLNAQRYRIDASTRPQDLVLSDAWLPFLGSTRIALGAEGGQGVLDRRGEIGMVVRALVADKPDLSFEEVDALLEGELSRVPYPTISPRHIEAVLTETAQLLVEGTYAGVLEPWVHYVPVKHDMSDLAEQVLGALNDLPMLERMTQRAYDDIITSGRYTWSTLAERFLDALDQFVPARAAATSRKN